MNILLNDKERELYKDVISELSTLCPQTIRRKISRANIQQAFILDSVRKVSDKEKDMLCVGSYEDTACESLVKLGYNVEQIDPVINMDLGEYFSLNSPKRFQVIFSTSVIEHVEKDELFIEHICKLLQKDGHGILTCDFNNNYKVGAGKPSEDYRLYTKNDLLVRLNKVLNDNGCQMFGEINYDDAPDFQYSGHTYSFASYWFKKVK